MSDLQRAEDAIMDALVEFDAMHISVMGVPTGMATARPGASPIMRLTLQEGLRLGIKAFLGKADWLWEEDLQMHIPCCSRTWLDAYLKPTVVCRNGPLVGEQIVTGDCGEHPDSPSKPEVEPEPECICPTECDCQAPDDPSCAGVSMACPVHNDNPDRVFECEAREHRNGAF